MQREMHRRVKHAEKIDLAAAVVASPDEAQAPVLVRMRLPFELTMRWHVVDAARLPAP